MRKPTARMTFATPRFATQIDVWGSGRLRRLRDFEFFARQPGPLMGTTAPAILDVSFDWHQRLTGTGSNSYFLNDDRAGTLARFAFSC